MPPTSRRSRNRQPELFPRSRRSTIEVAAGHRPGPGTGGNRRDGAGGGGAGDPPKKAKECGGPTATSSRVDRGVDVTRDATPDAPRPGRSDPVLRAGAVSLRADRDRLEPG